MSRATPSIDRTLLDAWRRAVRTKIERDLEEEAAAADERRRTLIPAVQSAIASARAQGKCGEAWLFGSYAWGRPAQRSDVDVLVEGCDDATALAAEIGAACRRDVHVVRREQAPASLVARVLTEGMRL